MNERNLVICDREIRYADSLGENISMREDLAVRVYVCSGLDKVTELAEERPIHLFLVDEGYTYQERNQIEANQVFVLGRGRVTDLGDEEWQVGKYQCADEIVREIFEVYIDKTKENIVRSMKKDRARLVAVYSPIHRVGKTTFAIALGKECAEKKKVLYLNLEEYAGVPEGEGLTLGDVLYYMRQGKGNLSIRLQAAVRKNGELDYLMPIPIVQDLKEVSEKEWEILLKELVENSMYEMVILDVGESVQGLFRILEKCNRIYMPILEDEISQNKLKQYDENLKQLNLEKIERTTTRFVIPEPIEEYARARAKEEI